MKRKKLYFVPILESNPFEGNWIASIISQLCKNCGIYNDYCRFDVINQYHTDFCTIDNFKVKASDCVKEFVHPGLDGSKTIKWIWEKISA